MIQRKRLSTTREVRVRGRVRVRKEIRGVPLTHISFPFPSFTLPLLSQLLYLHIPLVLTFLTLPHVPFSSPSHPHKSVHFPILSLPFRVRSGTCPRTFPSLFPLPLLGSDPLCPDPCPRLRTTFPELPRASARLSCMFTWHLEALQYI